MQDYLRRREIVSRVGGESGSSKSRGIPLSGSGIGFWYCASVLELDEGIHASNTRACFRIQGLQYQNLWSTSSRASGNTHPLRLLVLEYMTSNTFLILRPPSVMETSKTKQQYQNPIPESGEYTPLNFWFPFSQG